MQDPQWANNEDRHTVHDDFMRAAEMSRLVAEARTGRQKKHWLRFSRDLILDIIGRTLIAWGTRLREQYGQLSRAEANKIILLNKAEWPQTNGN